MLPPGLPKGSRKVAARYLAAGDLVFLELATSPSLTRSLILAGRDGKFLVKNVFSPEPYEVYLPRNKQVWTLKMKPYQDDLDTDSRARETTSRYWEPVATEEDFRRYWKWDPNDRRAQQEFHAVEEREWRRFKFWEQKKQAKKPPPRRKAPTAKVDDSTAGWYKLLGVKAGCSAKELKSAYKKAAFRFHPDRCKDSNAEEMFKRVSEAYRSLSCLLGKKRS